MAATDGGVRLSSEIGEANFPAISSASCILIGGEAANVGAHAEPVRRASRHVAGLLRQIKEPRLRNVHVSDLP